MQAMAMAEEQLPLMPSTVPCSQFLQKKLKKKEKNLLEHDSSKPGKSPRCHAAAGYRRQHDHH
jgi:hypothetical protein